MSLGKVVVWVTPQFETDEETGHVIGCFRELNLYAHGTDREHTLNGLKLHFRRYIEALRGTGELQDRLETVSVRWKPYDQAVADGETFEDLNPDAYAPEQDNGSDRLLPRVGEEIGLAAAA